MMNRIWPLLILAAVLCAGITGRIEEVGSGMMNGAAQAVTLCLQLLGGMALWSGLLEVARQSGLTRKLAQGVRPILSRFLTGLGEKGMQAVSMNLIANLLGMGNAATPFGLQAMQRMRSSPKEGENTRLCRSRARFVVLNTASVQIIPTTVLFLRQAAGSKNPAGILLGVWVTTLFSLCTACLALWLIQKGRKG